jgi:hypothetical protein
MLRRVIRPSSTGADGAGCVSRLVFGLERNYCALEGGVVDGCRRLLYGHR